MKDGGRETETGRDEGVGGLTWVERGNGDGTEDGLCRDRGGRFEQEEKSRGRIYRVLNEGRR